MMNKQQYHNRIFIIMAVLLAAGLIIVVRLADWQIQDHQFFVELANQQNQRKSELNARRGSIYDSGGHLLAVDTVQYEVSASPNMFKDAEKIADRLYRLLDIPREELVEVFAGDDVSVLLTRSAPAEVGNTLLEWDLAGLVVTPRSKRAYPENELAAHLLGFVNDNNNGYYGVEGFYDEALRGQPGHQTSERGPYGDLIPMGEFEVTPATEGADLHLTIDRTIQQAMQEELIQAIALYGAESGSVVAMEPTTGRLLASASWPTYNPNDYAFIEDQDLFVDPVVSQNYEPGSVFKIVTMAAALDANIVGPGTTVYDGGSIEVGGQTIFNADRMAHGTVDMTTVLAKSLNVGTAQIAMAMGPDQFYNYVRRFGFGDHTQVDLEAEAQGSLTVTGDPGWYQSALANNSFGQGIAVTPIQIASAVSAIANNGLLMQPQVVQKVTMHDTGRVIEVEPKEIRRAVSADTANVLTQMLVSALEVENSQAMIPGYKVAGKSGTAQIPIVGGYHPNQTITSFAGYFPADDPQVVVVVILHKPTTSQWATNTASPAFRSISERLISLMDIPPDNVRLAQR